MGWAASQIVETLLQIASSPQQTWSSISGKPCCDIFFFQSLAANNSAFLMSKRSRCFSSGVIYVWGASWNADNYCFQKNFLSDAKLLHMATFVFWGRVSRELGCKVWSIDWGTLKKKPMELFSWASPHDATLKLISAKEDGHCLYSTAPLTSSPSANWVLKVAKHQGEVYARLPLCFTPSKTVALPQNSKILYQPVDENTIGQDWKDRSVNCCVFNIQKQA